MGLDCWTASCTCAVYGGFGVRGLPYYSTKGKFLSYQEWSNKYAKAFESWITPQMKRVRYDIYQAGWHRARQ